MSRAGNMHLFVQLAGSLDRQRMHRNALRRKLDHAPYGIGEYLRRFAGQRRDQIHVDIVKSQLPRKHIGAHGILPRVHAPDARERFIVKRLRVDGNAVHFVRAKHNQLFAIDGIGSARLHRPFHRIGKFPLRRGEDGFQIMARDRRGRAAADVRRAHAQIRFAHQARGCFDFMQQRPRVRRDQLSISPDFAGGKAAIAAPRAAERNADVQIEHAVRHAANAALHIRDIAQQLRAILGYIEFRFQPRAGFRQGKPHIQPLIQKARGTNAGQRAPRRLHAGDLL